MRARWVGSVGWSGPGVDGGVSSVAEHWCADVYPPRLGWWWEVAMVTMDVCAAVVEGIGAVWYPPKEVRLER